MKIIENLKLIFTKKEFFFFYIILISGTLVTVLDLISFVLIIPLFNIVFLNENINFFNIKLNIIDTDVKLLLIIFFVLLFIIKNFLIIFYNLIFVNFFRDIKTKVINKLFNLFLKQEYNLFLQNSSKNILQKMTDNVNHLDILLNSFVVCFVEILFIIGILIISNKQTPSKFDEKVFQKKIDSLNLIVEKNNKLRDSLQLDNDKRQNKIGELSNQLSKLNEKSKFYEKKYKEELDIINDMSDDDIISAFSNTFK